jgi:hypothetical protein
MKKNTSKASITHGNKTEYKNMGSKPFIISQTMLGQKFHLFQTDVQNQQTYKYRTDEKTLYKRA